MGTVAAEDVGIKSGNTTSRDPRGARSGRLYHPKTSSPINNRRPEEEKAVAASSIVFASPLLILGYLLYRREPFPLSVDPNHARLFDSNHVIRQTARIIYCAWMIYVLYMPSIM